MKQYFDIIPPEEENIQPQVEKNEVHIPIKKNMFSAKKEKVQQVTNIKKEKESPKAKKQVKKEETKEEKIETITPEVTKEKEPVKPKPEVKVKNPYHKKFNKTWTLSFFTIMLVSIVFLLFTFVFDKANVEVTTQKSAYTYEGQLKADIASSNVNVTNNVVPGKLVEITESMSDTYKSTGKVETGAYATGIITIYNNFSQTPQVLVNSTRFETKEGYIYRIQERVVVPGATLKNGELIPATIDVRVKADETGSKYNLQGPIDFTIPGFKGTERFKGFYGKSEKGMSNGSDGESIVVTKVDLNKAENDIFNKLSDKLSEKLNQKISSDEILMDNSSLKIISTDDVSFDATIGESKENFKATISGTIKAIIIKKADLNKFLQAKITPNLEKETELYGEPKLEFINIQPNFKEQTVSGTVNAVYPFKSQVNEEEIINTIKGKSVSDIKAIFENNEKYGVTLKLKPFWINKIPKNESKINLTID